LLIFLIMVIGMPCVRVRAYADRLYIGHILLPLYLVIIDAREITDIRMGRDRGKRGAILGVNDVLVLTLRGTRIINCAEPRQIAERLKEIYPNSN
ncbi:MAG: hypothetical protein ABIC40_08930, partial [bacterium]